MKVLCRKIFSHTTGEDLGNSSPWLKVGQEYTVLAMSYSKYSGIYIYVQTENYNDPTFLKVNGFEFLSQYVPSSWMTDIAEVYGEQVITILPKSWNYNDFFEDMEDEEPHAMKLFKEESEKIYREEEEYCLAQAGKNAPEFN